MNLFLKEKDIDKNYYYFATYYLKSKTTLRDAAWNLAIGQSLGNPNVRSEFETEDMFRNHSCLILEDEEVLKSKNAGLVKIAFPLANINLQEDGVSQILVQTFGGQCDISNIVKCHLLKLDVNWSFLNGPKYGLSGIKKFCGTPEDKPLFGGITKPKIGLSPQKHLDLVKIMVDNGCDFIKEDEILSGASHCDMKTRLKLVGNYIKDKRVWYCASIHSDPDKILDRVKLAADLGVNGVHVNFHCGLGIYKCIRNLNLPLIIHFQKSGDKLLNFKSHNFHIDEEVIFDLVSKSGCDTLHCGMLGGYMNGETKKVKSIVNTLVTNNSVPALSCGMHPSLVAKINKKLKHGNWMANCGGCLSGHPSGTAAGVKAMRQAIDKTYGKEYDEAVKAWG